MYYGDLNLAMKLSRISQREMSDMLGVSESDFSRMMRGHKPWPIDICYAVLEILRIPKNEICTYFPPTQVKEMKAC